MHSSLKVSLKTDFLKCWWVGCSKKNCNIFCFQWYYLRELNFNTFNFWITELFLKTFKLYDDIWMIWQQMDNLNSALENVTKFQYLNTPLSEHWQHELYDFWFFDANVDAIVLNSLNTRWQRYLTKNGFFKYEFGFFE